MTACGLSSCDDRPKYNWAETYSSESKEPYGTYIVYNLLDGYSNGKVKVIDRSVQRSLVPSEASAHSCYVFIGHSLYLSEAGADSLLRFVSNGNDAFIATKQLPDELTQKFRSIGCSYESYGTLTSGNYDSIVNLNFYHPGITDQKGYDYSFYYRVERQSYKWYYVNTNNICDTANVVNYLGYMDNSRVNFIRIPYGKGSFFLHTTPLAFTNYYMVDKRGLDYATKVFSHIARGGVYWADNVSNIPIDDNDDGNQPEESPLRYVLSQPPLKWALYITLALLFIYVIVRSRRKQRVIPILEEKENTSLEFVQTIGTLYFQQNEHRTLALQKMKLFLQFIRNRYSIPTNHLNSETIQKISVKSQVSLSNVSSIVEQYQWIESMPEINDTNLITFHQSIDNFYKTCK